MITIVEYSEAYNGAFKKLNIEWLEKYFTVEPVDDAMLSDPRGRIIDSGGQIFFAVKDGTVIGTCALLAAGDQSYELGKMAVTESVQGLGVGRALMEHCLSFAKNSGAKKIFLFSNTKLVSAIHLYRKYGFVEVPLTGSSYVRTNIKMELLL